MSTVLSGSPISILSALPDNYDPNNLIAITAHRSQRYAESLGYENRYTSLSDMIEDLKRCIISDYGSMFQEESAEYSLKIHQHPQYSKTSVSSYYDGMNIMQVRDGNSVYRIGDVIYSQDQWWTTYIGQLKFLATTENTSIDINSSSFDGWVYADGAKYVTDGFEQAKAYLQSDASSFTVPELGYFFKCMPSGMEVQNGYPDVVPYNTVVPAHSHTLSAQFTGDVSVELSVTISKNAGDGGYSHAGSNAAGKTRKRQKIGVAALSASDIEITSIVTAKSDENLSQETYPTYNAVRVMIYIGEK